MNIIKLLQSIPPFIDEVSMKVAQKTKPFMDSKFGRCFQLIVLLGPLTFIPTMIKAWTADNIDPLRTATWPLMIIVNISALLLVIREGDWKMRLVSVIWILVMMVVFIATIVR